MKVDTWEFFEKLLGHFNFHLDVAILMTVLHEDLHISVYILFYL
jgi:hypothetical protein